MPAKIGTSRWHADCDIETGKIDYTEWVLRSRQKRHTRWGHYVSPGTTSYDYWVIKEKGVTWVKLSSKHFDWGFKKNVPDLYRYKVRTSQPTPYSATKLGALMKAAAMQRGVIKRFGGAPDPDFLEFLSDDEILAKLLAAQKRMRSKTNGK